MTADDGEGETKVDSFQPFGDAASVRLPKCSTAVKAKTSAPPPDGTSSCAALIYGIWVYILTFSGSDFAHEAGEDSTAR